MSGEILLKAQDARDAATKVTGAASDAQTDFDNLKTQLLPLADSFRGKSAEAFDAKINEWQTNAKALMDALDGLGTFLNSAANTIEDTDTTLASQLSS